MNPCDYSALREATGHLSRLGLSLQTVIPVALPAESYPVTKQNSKTGQREVQRDKNGQPLPAFVGKNPSFWLADGQPRLTSQSQPADESEVLKRLEVAEWLQQPIGLDFSSEAIHRAQALRGSDRAQLCWLELISSMARP